MGLVSSTPFVCMAILVLVIAGVTPESQAEGQNRIEVRENNCMTQGCHSILRELPFLHAPFLQEDCSVCHVDPADKPEGVAFRVSEVHDLVTLAPNFELCGGCHTEDRFPQGDVVHEPFTGRCDTCHDPHGGRNPDFLHAAQPAELCADCHDDMSRQYDYPHGPVVLGLCLDCHSAHTSKHEGLLRGPPEELCWSCHLDLPNRFEGEVHLHGAMEGSCLECHSPHGSDHPYFLPKVEDELCHTCHSGVTARAEEVAFPHVEMMKGRACSSCHDPHFGPHESLLRRSSLEICAGCHNEPVSDASGRMIAPVTQWLKERKYAHGPARDGNCVSCHAAHGSDEPLLLKGGFPENFYVAYDSEAYALCFDCHDRRLVESEFTGRTGFRDGDRNLHFVHVNQERGRSCRVCHDAHASDTAFLLRSSIEFGRWDLRISFTATATGGFCQDGCHGKREYERLPGVGDGR